MRTKVIPRIVMLGDTCVGKTSLVHRLVSKSFAPETRATTAAAFHTYNPQKNGLQELQIWDTAGMEQYRSLNVMYYRDAAAAVLVCDITNPKSIDNIESWYNDLMSRIDQQILVVIAANKSDLRDQVIEGIDNKLQMISTKIDAKYFYTSAVTGDNVQDIFDYLSQAIPEKEATTIIPKKEEKSCCY